MKHSGFALILSFLVVIFISACQQGDNMVSAMEPQVNEDQITRSVLKTGRTMIWVDCRLYESVVTPAAFKASSGKFDQLYAGGTFKDGIGLISESKPGNRDYNGGRWQLNLLKEGIPADKYSGACSVEDLDIADFESQSLYFECPLLSRKN